MARPTRSDPPRSPTPAPPRGRKPAAPLPLVLLRYVLFQLPGLGLFCFGAWAAHRWLGIPAVWAWVAVGAWVALDVVMFPFVRRAYEPGDDDRMHRDPRDEVGIAPQGLGDADGYVHIGPERWRARRAPGCPPIGPGERVHVVEVSGMTLVVEPATRAPGTGPESVPHSGS